MKQARILKLSEDRSTRLVLESGRPETRYDVDVRSGGGWRAFGEDGPYARYETAFLAYRRACQARGTGI